MSRDFARSSKAAPRRKQAPASRRSEPAPRRPWRWYFSGLFSGVIASLLFYLFTLPAGPGQTTGPGADGEGQPEAAPKPRFDFYTMLPEQRIEVSPDASAADAAAGSPATVERAAPAPATTEPVKQDRYLLQAGSFRQREDADRRRAELLLLGLEPWIEEASGDNGRWFRVFLGPFASRARMREVQGLTAAQQIDTLLLKRAGP